MFVFMMTIVSAIDIDRYYKVSGDINIKEQCLNNDNSYCDNTTNCNITVFDPDSDIVIENEPMTYNPSYYNYSFNTEKIGVFEVNINCYNSTNYGFSTEYIEVNDGVREIDLQVIILGLGIMCLIMIGMIFILPDMFMFIKWFLAIITGFTVFVIIPSLFISDTIVFKLFKYGLIFSRLLFLSIILYGVWFIVQWLINKVFGMKQRDRQ